MHYGQAIVSKSSDLSLPSKKFSMTEFSLDTLYACFRLALQPSSDRLTPSQRHFRGALRRLEAIDQTLTASPIPQECWETVDSTASLLDCCRDLAPLAEGEHLTLLDSESEQSKEFVVDVGDLRTKRNALEKAQELAKFWKERLPEAELPTAIEQAAQLEQSRFSWLRPSYWRLRGILRKRYDFGAHVVPPRWSQALIALQQLYAAETSADCGIQAVQQTYGIRGDIDCVVAQVAAVQAKLPQLSLHLRELAASLIKNPQAQKIIDQALTASPELTELRDSLDRIVDGYANRPLAKLRDELRNASGSLADLSDFLQCLTQLGEMPSSLAAVFTDFELPANQLEAAIASASVETAFRRDRQLHRFNAAEHRLHATRVADIYDKLLSANAREVCGRGNLIVPGKRSAIISPSVTACQGKKGIQTDLYSRTT
jgi:hypothetical protein